MGMYGVTYSSLSLLRWLIIRNAAYYDTVSISQLQKASEIYTGYFDSLDTMILLSYPISIIITRDYCTHFATLRHSEHFGLVA